MEASPVSATSTEASLSSSTGVSTGDQSVALQQEILKQLERVNARLETVEQDMETVKGAAYKQTDKISNSKSKLSVSDLSMSDSESESSDDSLIPDLNVLKSKKSIQNKVDQRLKQLQNDNISKSGKCDKFQSKRGGNVDCMVKHKVAWPQDSVLDGQSRQRVTYDQLSLTQWVQGFARNIIEEKSQDTRNHMLYYLADIMSDATDFSWQNAKAAHAVLLCDMERVAVSWRETSKIDRIRRAHAQKHSQNPKPWTKNFDANGGKKPWFCKAFQTGACNFSRDHDSNGKWQRHICATCLDKGKTLNHAEKDCNWAKKQKKRVRGCPGAKLAQGSSCHSHDPSVKCSESYPSGVNNSGTVCKISFQICLLFTL